MCFLPCVRCALRFGPDFHLCPALISPDFSELGSFFEEGFAADGVSVVHCPRLPALTPTSCVIVSAATGSRTIVHSNRDLPELPGDALRRLPLAEYDWIHFEVRASSSGFWVMGIGLSTACLNLLTLCACLLRQLVICDVQDYSHDIATVW